MPATFATADRKFIFKEIVAVIWKLALPRQIEGFSDRCLRLKQ